MIFVIFVIFVPSSEPLSRLLRNEGSPRIGAAIVIEEAARLLLELRSSALVRRLDEIGRRRLQALLPLLLAGIGASRHSLQVLHRVVRIIVTWEKEE